MSGAAPDTACRKRLRSHDSTMMKIQSDDNEEGKKMSGGGSEVKNRKTSIAAFLEKGKQKEGRTNSNKNMMADDQEKEERIIWNGHNKVKSTKEESTASLEKMKKKQKLCNANTKKKMQIDDNDEGKNRHSGNHKLMNRKESPTLCEKEKNKEKLNKTHKEKMWAADRKERKILSRHNSIIKSGEVSTAFFGKEKKGKRLNKTNNEELQSNGDEENAPFTLAVKEKRMRLSESTEAMMCHDKPNRRSLPSIVSKEKKIDTSSGSKYKKRKRDHTLPKKGKRSDNKIHSGRVQEKKICGAGKEKNKHTSFAFFKIIYSSFEEFLLIPPAVARNLADLTNHHVYLEDSEKRRSEVGLSVVNDSLAFYQGWNIFVSDHFIKRGEFLLFEYIARKKISVRIFGMNSCERLYFKKDPKRVEHGVGSGSAPQDNNNEDDACMHSQRKTVIMISD